MDFIKDSPVRRLSVINKKSSFKLPLSPHEGLNNSPSKISFHLNNVPSKKNFAILPIVPSSLGR